MNKTRIAMGLLLLSLSLFHSLAFSAKTVVYKKETKQYIIDIQYPQDLGNQQVDHLVKDFITEIQQSEMPEFSTDLPKDLPGKNSIYIRFKIPFQQKRALSLLFSISTYARGAAHPSNTIRTLNFIDNKIVSLQQLFKPNSEYLSIIAHYCQKELLAKINADEKWIKSGTASSDAQYKNWTFNDKGLNIIFDTYQVAAYVYGPQMVMIPQSLLKPLFQDKIENAIWGSA